MSAVADQAERDRIVHGVGESLCVEAGAGTGKTTVLVDRIVEVLRTGAASIDELAVITFTDKAAGELSARVRQYLERAHDEARGEERLRLHDALAGLYRARIETIHQFAANLLRRRPVEAGLDPGFEVLSGLAAELHFEEAFDAWLHELLDDPDARPEVTAALNRGLELDELRDLANLLHHQRHRLPLAPQAAPGRDPAALLVLLAEAEDKLPGLAASATAEDRALPQIPGLLDFARRCRLAAADPRELERVVLLRSPRLSPSYGNKANYDPPANGTELKRIVSAVAGELAALQGAWRAEALAWVLPLAEGFVAAYAGRRRAAGIADFDDILIWARDLLRDQSVREWFQARFTAVLIDEFQDTDAVQAELALALTNAAAPGRLTVVGDPKQAIYRFRGADISVYDEVRTGPLAAQGVTIKTNFRSTRPVLQWCNAVFDDLLVEVPRIQPANVALVPHREADGPGVEVLAPELEDKPTRPQLQAAEADAIARWIGSRVGVLEVADRATGEMRPARPGDVAVLVPRRTGFDAYAEALALTGLPVRLEGGKRFFLRQEVRELINVLRAVDDPGDAVSLVAALRAVPFGISDEDVFRWVQAGGRLDMRAAESGPPGAVADGLALLDGLRRERRGLSLPEFVFQAVERTHMAEVALALPDGVQAAANVVKVVDHARSFAASGGGGLREFAHWLAGSSGGDEEESEAGVVEESDDVVRVMTIHAAKGLEFPIVVLASIFGRGGGGGASAVPDAAGRLQLRIGSAKRRGEFATPGFADATEREKEFERAERVRLLYVAATRARDRLVIAAPRAAGKPPGDGGSLLALLAPLLPGGERDTGLAVTVDLDALPAPDAAIEPPPAPDDAEIAAELAEAEAWAARRADVRHAAAAPREVVPASGEGLHAEVPLAPALGTDDAPVLLGEGPPREIGEALHRVLELVDLPAGETLAPVTAAVCLQAGLAGMEEEVAALARACLATPVMARIAAAAEVHRELPYVVAREPDYLVGRIDLLFRDAGGWVVVDWKTDAVGPEGAAARAAEHAPQLRAYAAALERAAGIELGQAVLVFPRAGCEQAVALG